MCLWQIESLKTSKSNIRPVSIELYAGPSLTVSAWHGGCDRSWQQKTKETIMANKTLFQSLRGALLPKADSTNEAGGPAYALSPKHALAQYAATGCLNSTYYASADDQLQKVLNLAKEVDAEFIAKTAVFGFFLHSAIGIGTGKTECIFLYSEMDVNSVLCLFVLCVLKCIFHKGNE